MTNLIHTCFILQYIYYNPLHVSSIIFSLCIDAASDIVAPTKWPSGALVERGVLSQPVHRTVTY